VNGELKNGKVKHQCSQRFHQKIRTNNIGLYPFMGEKEAWRQSMPLTAFNNGQEYGPP
jgi:hypothetical protein